MVDWPACREEIHLERTRLSTELCVSSEFFQQVAPRAARHQVGRQSGQVCIRDEREISIDAQGLVRVARAAGFSQGPRQARSAPARTAAEGDVASAR